MKAIATSKTYLLTAAALLGLLALTIAVAYLNLGPLNTMLALSISIAKGLIILLFFMHLRWGSRLCWVVAATGFFWLAIMFALSLSDFMTRH